jgi:stage II sporulation protein D
MHSRTLVAVSTLAAAVAVVSSTHAAAPPSQYVAPVGSGALFVISGHGWGHGVGMGQWGAEGYALQNYPYQQILAAYYPGTALGQSSVKKIRVLLADGRKRLTLSSDQPVAVVDGNGASHTLAAGSTKLTPALDLAVDGRAAQPLTPPLTFSPTAGSALTLGRAYRGRILVDVVDGKLRAINILPLEQYLYGVVPSEAPSSWVPAALEAQAVASRSYAIASRRVAAPFDVYSDTRSQAYLGISAETPDATAAVDDTAHEVLFYGNKVATTVFSSSSGGLTESAADAWGGQGEPYLVSVRDPYDAISPYHNWGPVPVTAKSLAQALGLSGQVVDATVTRNSSHRVAMLDVSSLVRGLPTTTEVAGGSATSKLGLRSDWFTVGVLALQPPAAAVTYGSSLTLTGVVRGLKGVVLQTRSGLGAWTELEPVTADPSTGAFSVSVQPATPTSYRLATAADAAAAVPIRLAPAVSLSTASRSSVSGQEQPALPGARVLVEQQLKAGSQKWTVVAQGATLSDGSFTVSAGLQPGAVRVVVSPGNGWAQGASNGATVP